MSIIDKAIEANRNHAKNYDPKLGNRPAPKLQLYLHGSTALRPPWNLGSAGSRY
jgi:hypothetical protein